MKPKLSLAKNKTPDMPGGKDIMEFIYYGIMGATGITITIFMIWAMISGITEKHSKHSPSSSTAPHEPKEETASWEEKYGRLLSKAQTYESMVENADHVIDLQSEELKELRAENSDLMKQLDFERHKYKELSDLARKHEQAQYLVDYFGLDHFTEIWDKDFFDDNTLKNYRSAIATAKFHKAINAKFVAISHIQVHCKMRSFTDPKEEYETSLAKCDCWNYRSTKLPCKHMLALALKVHAFDYDPDLYAEALQEISNRLEELAPKEEAHKKQLQTVQKRKS